MVVKFADLLGARWLRRAQGTTIPCEDILEFHHALFIVALNTFIFSVFFSRGSLFLTF